MTFRFSGVAHGNTRCVALFATLVATLCIPLASCKDAPSLPKVTLGIEKVDASGTAQLAVEVARTEREQEKGYMERKDIPEGTGMIFAYDADQQMHFWMKNTPHALSIAFIDSEGVLRENLRHGAVQPRDGLERAVGPLCARSTAGLVCARRDQGRRSAIERVD